MSKVGDFSLDMAISMILYDMGPMTKKKCFEIFKPLEITDAEFDKSWEIDIKWGHIIPDFCTTDDNEFVNAFKADNHISGLAQYIPKLWETILGDSPTKTFTFEVTCKEMHRDRVLHHIKEVPAVLDVKLKE